MNKHDGHLYLLLQQELDAINALGLKDKETIEVCFRIAENYLQVINEKLKEHVFETTEEAILFFKNIQPKFRALTEYYRLLYHSVLFCENTGEDEQKLFWKREYKRLERFTKEYRLFYDYYKANDTHFDAELFTQKQVPAPNFYKKSTEPVVSSHSGLVAQLLALERYHIYVEQQLKKMKEDL